MGTHRYPSAARLERTGPGTEADRRWRKVRRGGLVTGLLLLAAPGPTEAQQAAPFARAQRATTGVVTVGQPVEIRVEVLVSTWFARAPEFPSLNLENAIVTPPGRSVNFNERVGGQQYFGIRRAYTVYPQVAGSYEVPELSLTVRPGGSDEVVTVSTDPLGFEARIPPDAAGLDYFIGTTRLTLSQSVEPRADTLRVGDALTRTVRMTVLDALSLVLPPLTFDTVPGMAVYPDPAVVTDEGGERGTQRIGRRVESVTYVMETEGVYELPEVEIAWWDLGGERLRRSTIPAIRFHVQRNPDYVADFEIPPDPDSLPRDAGTGGGGISRTALVLGTSGALALLVLLWTLRRFGPRWRGRVQRWRRERRETEAAYLERLRRACRANDPARAMRSLMAWLDRRGDESRAATVRGFVAEAGDPELGEAIGDLERHLYGPGEAAGTVWRGLPLLRAVRRHARRRKPATRAAGRWGTLSPLNPGPAPDRGSRGPEGPDQAR